MPEQTRIQHPNPATVRAMIAHINKARLLGEKRLATKTADTLHRAINDALEPLGLTLAEAVELRIVQ